RPPSSPQAPDTHLGGGVLLRQSPRPHGPRRPSSLTRVNEWLARQADALAEGTGIERAALELSPQEIDTVLGLAAHAAHESDARTNAPLLCYLLGDRKSTRLNSSHLGISYAVF